MEDRTPGARGWAILILIVWGVFQFCEGACTVRNLGFMHSMGRPDFPILSALMACWLGLDCRGRGRLQFWDAGFFAFFAWPCMLPYYFVKTRGLKRAVLYILLGVAVDVGSYLLGTMMFRRT